MKYSSDPKITWLIDEFLRIKSTNPAYSLRGFASKIGVSPSFLSQVFQGKKELSDDSREKIVSKLNFTDEQKLEVDRAIRLYRSNLDDINRLKDRLTKTKLHDHIEKLHLNAEEYLPLIEWYHDAVFHLLDKPNKHKTIIDIANELDIPHNKLYGAITKLEEYELISKNDQGTYSKNYDSYGYYGDIASRQLASIKEGFINNQEEILGKLKKKFLEGDSSLTHVTTTYVNIPEDEIGSAFILVEDFIKKLEALYSKETEKKEKLFCFNTQLLGLNKDN